MRTGIYLIPSILTAGNMALGFYSILSSLNEEWAIAAWCILAAILFDMVDGRVARWTHTSSKFGIEFDSFSDWISFGIAPAVLMYQIVLKDLGRIGLAIAFLYVICGSLRLARFNLKSLLDKEQYPYFVGLPIPAAGGILASFVILYDIWSEGKQARTIQLVMRHVPSIYHLLPGIVFLLSILMVSEIRYSSFKKGSLVKPKTLQNFLIFVLVCLMIYIYPQNTIFILFVAYICSGILGTLWRATIWNHRKKDGNKDISVETPEGHSWEIKRKRSGE